MKKTINFLVTLVVAIQMVFSPLGFIEPHVANAAATDVKNDSSLGDADLVSAYELEEASGTRIDSHSSNDLQDNGTVLSTTGIQGDAADFTYTLTEYLSITNASQTGLDFSGDFAFAFWYKTARNGTQMLIDKMYTSGQYAYSMRYIGSLNRPRFNISDDGTSDRQMDWLNVDLEGNTWRHIVFQYDATAKEGELYVNAVSQGTRASGAAATGVHQGTDTFNIGARNGTTPMDGGIDEFLAYSKLLTATDISNLYNGGSGIPYDAGGAPPAATFIPKPNWWW